MIVLYKGARGRGKTLTMVKDAYIYYKAGYNVLSNLKLPFGRYISNDGILALSKVSDIKDAVLVIDEIQVFFDSRSFMSEVSKRFSNFLQQIRKRNVHILCTTQYANTIDIRLRQHLDYIAYPRHDKKLHICRVTYVDVTSLEDDLQIYGLQDPIYAETIYDASKVYALFDTKQLIS